MFSFYRYRKVCQSEMMMHMMEQCYQKIIITLEIFFHFSYRHKKKNYVCVHISIVHIYLSPSHNNIELENERKNIEYNNKKRE